MVDKGDPKVTEGIVGLSPDTLKYYGIGNVEVTNVTFQSVDTTSNVVVTTNMPNTGDPVSKTTGPVVRDANTNTLTLPNNKVVVLPESSNAAKVVPAEKRKNFIARFFGGIGNFFKSLFGKKK